MSTAIANRNSNGNGPAKPAVVVLLEQARDRLDAALPRHLTPERVLQVVQTLYFRTPKLQECPPESIVMAVMQASELGLDLSPVMGEAYLIPRWNSKARVLECQFEPGYKGLVKLARQSGDVGSIRAELVREDDPFVYRYTPDLELHHQPIVGSEAPVIAVYAVAKLGNGERLAAVLSAAEVEAIRGRSKSGDSGPWVTDWGEMAKKTAVKRLCKMLPRSLELATAIDADDASYRAEPVEVVARQPGQSKTAALAESIRGPQGPALPAPEPEPDHGDDHGHAAVNASYPAPPETTTRKPARNPRQRWEEFLEKLMDRWHESDPIQSDQDLTSRQHRVAHDLCSQAIAAGRLSEAAISKTNAAGKTVRDPSKVWEAVHALAEVDFAWVREAALAHLKAKLDELPKEAPRRARPAPLTEVPPVPPTGSAEFDEFDTDDEPRPIAPREREPGED